VSGFDDIITPALPPPRRDKVPGDGASILEDDVLGKAQVDSLLLNPPTTSAAVPPATVGGTQPTTSTMRDAVIPGKQSQSKKPKKGRLKKLIGKKNQG
jgi:hypothetical protein